MVFFINAFGPLRWAIAWVPVCIFAGCEHSHHHHNPKVSEARATQVTLWGDPFEIFLEYEPLVMNTASTVVTHITEIKSGQPRRTGKITFALQPQGGASSLPVKHIEDSPAQPGIYLPELTFPGSGPWKVTILIPQNGEDIAFELPEVRVFQSADEIEAVETTEAQEGITFLKEQQWKLGTRIRTAQKQRLVERVRVVGSVTAPPRARAAVTPPLAGRLLFPPGGSLPTLGEHVNAGQSLGLVQPPFSDFVTQIVTADAQLVQAKLALDLAELSLTRVERLALKKVKSERERKEADFAFQGARANHEAALALREAYRKAGAVFSETSDSTGLPSVELRAPISGVAVDVNATAGEYIQAERSVFTILNLDPVFIEARIPEPDLQRIGAARAATYETLDSKGRFVPILEGGRGRVVFLGLEIDPRTRTVPLIYEVSNPDGHLRIGMALNIYLETERVEEALAIPLSAVVDEEGNPVAFVQIAGETFEKRMLRLGIREGNFVQVLSGLTEDEHVVTDGAYAVRLASISTRLPVHGHEH